VLSDYVLALIRHDLSGDELKTFIAEQLEDFLAEGAWRELLPVAGVVLMRAPRQAPAPSSISSLRLCGHSPTFPQQQLPLCRRRRTSAPLLETRAARASAAPSRPPAPRRRQ
jgi:hypothetical protein